MIIRWSWVKKTDQRKRLVDEFLATTVRSSHVPEPIRHCIFCSYVTLRVLIIQSLLHTPSLKTQSSMQLVQSGPVKRNEATTPCSGISALDRVELHGAASVRVVWSLGTVSLFTSLINTILLLFAHSLVFCIGDRSVCELSLRDQTGGADLLWREVRDSNKHTKWEHKEKQKKKVNDERIAETNIKKYGNVRCLAENKNVSQ
jgi:hypothetical protein